MPRTTKKVSTYVKRGKSRKQTAAIKAIKEKFKAERRIRKGLLLPSPSMTTTERRKKVAGAVKIKVTKGKKKTSVTYVKPSCSTAGRKLKTTRSSAAGKKLASAACSRPYRKTKASSTSTKKRTYKRKSTASSGNLLTSIVKPVKKVVKSILGGGSSKSSKGGVPTLKVGKKVTKSTIGKRKTTKSSASSAARKVARIKRIVC